MFPSHIPANISSAAEHTLLFINATDTTFPRRLVLFRRRPLPPYSEVMIIIDKDTLCAAEITVPSRALVPHAALIFVSQLARLGSIINTATLCNLTTLIPVEKSPATVTAMQIQPALFELCFPSPSSSCLFPYNAHAKGVFPLFSTVSTSRLNSGVFVTENHKKATSVPVGYLFLLKHGSMLTGIFMDRQLRVIIDFVTTSSVCPATREDITPLFKPVI